MLLVAAVSNRARNATVWAGTPADSALSAEPAGLIGAMIAKDFPFVKDLPRIRCFSFVIMQGGQPGAGTERTIAGYARFARHAGLALAERRRIRRGRSARFPGAGTTAGGVDPQPGAGRCHLPAPATARTTPFRLSFLVTGS
jgi:hypothetical protein